MAIHISNQSGRDAVVALNGIIPRRELAYLDTKGKPVKPLKVLKSNIQHDIDALLKTSKTLPKLSKHLIDGDPEIDIEQVGMYMSGTSRVYVSKGKIIHSVVEFEVVTTPEGKVKDRRPRKKRSQNLDVDVPLNWTGKFIKKEDAIAKFVFTTKRQLVHINGLTFDFLFEMAKTLEERNSLLLIQGGDKGNEPIVLNRGGKAFNGFLEGRVKGKTYCLILHLSDVELKRPKEVK